MLTGEPTWEVPGYHVCRLLGTGWLGQVWLAVELDTGVLVVLRSLRGIPPEEVSGLDHVVRCRDRCEIDGELVLVMEHLPGGSLSGRRGQLSAGQVVTALAPIAGALARAHQLGLVHGRLTSAEILLSAEGKPVLDGLGLQRAGTRQDDVRALVAVGLELLAPGSEGPVRDVLLAAEDGDADDLATALLAVCVAEPLRAPVLAVPAVPEQRRRRWPVALPILLAALVAVGYVRQPEPGPSWSAVLQALDDARADAFARADPGLLRRVYVTGSAALAEDTDRLRALRVRHQSAHGLRHRLSVRSAAADGDLAHVEVIASLTAYEIEGPAATRRVVPAGPPVTQHLTLLRTAAGWRVARVTG